jgi:hypothetical protein
MTRDSKINLYTYNWNIVESGIKHHKPKNQIQSNLY